MALKLELLALQCAELAVGEQPADAEDCALFIEAEVGHSGGGERETFSFTAITPRALARYREVRWGRGCLLMSRFSWHEVEQMLLRLLTTVEVDSWTEAVVELRKFMDWEFDQYRS